VTCWHRQASPPGPSAEASAVITQPQPTDHRTLSGLGCSSAISSRIHNLGICSTAAHFEVTGSQNRLRWKDPLKAIWSPLNKQGHPQLHRCSEPIPLSVHRDGVPLPLDIPCQCLTSLSVKNFFLISHLNLPSFGLKLFPHILSQGITFVALVQLW